MNKLIQRMFENRGYTESYLASINRPEYDVLKDIDSLVARLKILHDSQATVTIYPDYDTDGVCSGTLLFAGLAELGFAVNLFIPDSSSGYGCGKEDIVQLLKDYPATKAVLTCDVGIGASEAADYCKEQGIEFLVTDHHKQASVINASVIVNPMRLDETYSHPAICGAFVAYQVLQRYADVYGNLFIQDQIRRLKVFAGIGTLSDSMPLLYENRQAVLDAVNILRLVYANGTEDFVNSVQGSSIYRRSFYGLYYILKRVCEDGHLKNEMDINEELLNFYVNPAVNSGKRVNADMGRMFGIFFGNSPAVDVDYAFACNEQRKALVASGFEDLGAREQPLAPHIYISTSPKGVLGLIATQLPQDFGPVFVINDMLMSEDYNPFEPRFSGSGRSPSWYPCLERLSSMYNLAGHDYAFGCSFFDEDELLKFYEYLMKDVKEVYDSLEVVEAVPDYLIATDWSGDTGIDVALFAEYLTEREDYRPFGKGFESPVGRFEFTDNDVISWQCIGAKKNHLKLIFSNGFSLLCWNQSDKIKLKGNGEKHYADGDLSSSVYMGEMSVNFVGRLIA